MCLQTALTKYITPTPIWVVMFFSFFFQLDFFSEMGFIEFINFVLVVKREEFPRIEARSKNIKETIYFLENESRHAFY